MIFLNGPPPAQQDLYLIYRCIIESDFSIYGSEDMYMYLRTRYIMCTEVSEESWKGQVSLRKQYMDYYFPAAVPIWYLFSRIFYNFTYRNLLLTIQNTQPSHRVFDVYVNF